jgi:ligand-binding SRPBCC domain-containing protein
MKIFSFSDELLLPYPREQVFQFFADAGNLEKITPPWLQFQIKTPRPIEMRSGARIDYQLRVHGLPVRWRTHITVWEPPFRFVDVQERGPYRFWEHEHRFEEIDSSTRVLDRVRYAVWGGAWIERFFVRADVRRIFTYRRDQISRWFQAESGLSRGDQAVVSIGSGTAI